MNDRVSINECFARDGLQHESAFVPTAKKLAVLASFTGAGFRRIEATSYSHPKQVPAFTDASELLSALPRREGISFKATCPNQKAVQRALADAEAGYGADEISLLTSASNSHSQVNLRASRLEQWQKVEEMAAIAAGNFTLVGVVSVAFGCPFEGAIDPQIVIDDVARFRDLGAGYVTIGDTTGLADPAAAKRLFAELVPAFPELTIVAHFHDTRGLGIANIMAAYEAGCRSFDSAMGGVGGHPNMIHYGSGSTGNVATEDTVNLFDSLGVDTGLDLDAVMEASAECESILGRTLLSKTARAGLANTILREADVA
ncbi:hydroxymethylglutaryl-CoA lyase [Brevibacterium sp. K11IcPPYGO002]|uniref:hydroxymethylglutaryl-CoA lyase n=1 Tax=Brevibacterium sp. K11IcPPYGO002 TaxID=3058837 RepID=UPI003D81329F